MALCVHVLVHAMVHVCMYIVWDVQLQCSVVYL